MGKEERNWAELQVSVRTFSYRLRIALALCDSLRHSLLAGKAVDFIHELLTDLLEASDRAASFIESSGLVTSEASLGEDQ